MAKFLKNLLLFILFWLVLGGLVGGWVELYHWLHVDIRSANPIQEVFHV